MEINKLIELSQKELIGKEYFSSAVSFAFNNEFGKAYEFFKLGLDILTCDCQKGWLAPNAETNKKIFDDINVKHIPHFEYYFVKAYILSYQSDKKSQYQALDAIDKYLEIKRDKYGCYVKGKILFSFNDNRKALLYFEEAMVYGINHRLLYRIGRTKEKLIERGLDELFYSFFDNPSSACCARILKQTLKLRGILAELEIDRDNPLLLAFISDENEWNFQYLYEKIQKELIDCKYYEREEISRKINSFIQGIIQNKKLIAPDSRYGLEDYYDYDDDDFDESYDIETYGNNEDSYTQRIKHLRDNFIDDVLDGEPDAYWNID